MPYSLGTNDDLAVKLWSSKMTRDVLPSTILSEFVGKDKSNSVMVIKDEISKRAGDRLRIPFLHLSDQSPIKGVPIDGNENSLNYDNYDLEIDKESYAERREVDLTDERAEFNFREDMKYVLSNRWTESMEIQLLNVLCGNSLGTDHSGQTGFDANNTIDEPDATHHLFAGAGNSADTDLAAADILTSTLIRQAATLAETLRTESQRPIIKRAKLPSSSTPSWGLVIPPRQREHLFAEAADAGTFYGIQTAMIQGGDTGDSNILKGRYVNTMYQKVGMYAGVCIYVDPYTPYGNDGTDPLTSVDRMPFVGAGAGAVGFGRKNPGIDKFGWREETFRYAEEYGIAATAIWGAVKARIDSQDLGVITISAHALAS